MKRGTTAHDAPKAGKRKLITKDSTTESGGLLKFGFIGAPKVESTSTAVEFSQCPHCSGLFNSLSIFEHVEHCSNKVCVSIKDPVSTTAVDQHEHSGTKTNSNAFDIMRKSAALKPPSTSSATSMHFALLLKNDKLLPVFSPSVDYVDQLFVQSSNSNATQWACEANVKKFRWHFDNTEPSHQTIVLHLSTNIPEDTSVSFADTAPISTGWLKSMLQKAVRRKLNTKAIKLANMMCKSTIRSKHTDTASSSTSNMVSTMFSCNKASKSDPRSETTSAASSNTSLLSELLRRLPIICLEDAALHPAYPIVIWLMVAVSKGYTPNRFLVNTLLLITNDIANCTYNDCTPPADFNLSVNKMYHGNDSGVAKGEPSLSPAGTDTNTTCLHTYASIENDSVRTLIACICIRASFGGMLGDIEMLDQYAQLWYRRLACDDSSVSSSQQSNIGGTDQLASVDANKGTTSLSMENYLDPTYTTGFFKDTNSSKHWAQQMFDNFPTKSLQLVSTTNTSHHLVPAISDTDNTSTITSRVETYLLDILQGRGTHPVGSTSTDPPANSTNNALPKYNPTPKISTLLRVTAQDLVPEGLDHHCDWGLVPSVLSTCTERVKQLTAQLQEISTPMLNNASPEAQSTSGNIRSVLSILNDPQLERNIKNAIWLFRSANNSRKLYPLISQNMHNAVNQAIFTHYQELVDSDLAQKRSLAKLWGIVCPMIVAYCERKMVALSNRL